MNGPTTAPDDVGRYIGAVRDALADLPADERDDLSLDLEEMRATVVTCRRSS
jgi:hypothetical protein